MLYRYIHPVRGEGGSSMDAWGHFLIKMYCNDTKSSFHSLKGEFDKRKTNAYRHGHEKRFDQDKFF